VADLNGRVVRVDPVAGAIAARIDVDEEPFGILSTGSAILSSGDAAASGGVVIEIDPTSAIVSGQLQAGTQHLGQMRCVGGHLWVTDLEGGNVLELSAPVCP
jgi:hypothetical protein